MEKKILTVSSLCFLMIGAIAVAGFLIDDTGLRRIIVIGGCLLVVWMSTLNFKYLKLMKKQVAETTPEVPSLVHWLQGETWPEILGADKIKAQFGEELEVFLQAHPDCDEAAIKGYRIWRTDETEQYFEEAGPAAEQILVLMDGTAKAFQVFGSKTLQEAMEAHQL